MAVLDSPALPTCSVARSDRGAAATGHPLATEAAVEALRHGGSAADAAVAAHAVLAVVMPDACGVGGDALFLVRAADGRVEAFNGSGPTSRTATAEPATDGGASVTVPGAVRAWADLLGRHGRLPLAAALAPAVEIAARGFAVPRALARAVSAQLPRLVRGGAVGWGLVKAQAGDTVVQPQLANLLRAVALHGPDAFYTGPVAAALCRAVERDRGRMCLDDLANHRTTIAQPVTVDWAGGRVHVQPPVSQGVLLAMALQWLDRHADAVPVAATDGAWRDDGAALDHLCVELTEAVFAFRDRCARDGAALLAEPLHVDRHRAARRGGPRPYLHTTGVAVADAGGQVVSSLLSVFDDFGAGTFVPEGGYVLTNRAGGFTTGPNAPGPGRRPVHTLAPAVLERPDGGVVALATPGADGQVQTLLQVLAHLRFEGRPLAEAVAAPRWRSVEGALVLGARHPGAAGLEARGHEVQRVDDGDARFGAVVSATYDPAADPAGRTTACGDWRRGVKGGGA